MSDLPALPCPGAPVLAVPPAARRAVLLEFERIASVQRRRLVIDLPSEPAQAPPATAPAARATLQSRLRRMRSGGALVEVTCLDGRLRAGEHSAPLHELHFRLLAGPAAALHALQLRWCRRFGLTIEPRSLAERGALLARGPEAEPPRKSARPVFAPGDADATVLGHVLDECLDQVLRNGCSLQHAEGAQAAAHVHQLRVGLRRLRSALRTFEGWTPAPPPALLAGLQALFGTLGQARDADVLGAGVVAALARAGAPPLPPAPPDPAAPAVDPAQVMRSAGTQQLLLAWCAWRGEALAEAPAAGTPAALAPRAAHRLARWHARIAEAVRAFDTLDEPAVHRLRKRIKRQRYAVDFLAPLLKRRDVERTLASLAEAQERLGALTDLYVARAHYQALATPDTVESSGPWFALGWLAARIDSVRADCTPALRQLAGQKPPRAR